MALEVSRLKALCRYKLKPLLGGLFGEGFELALAMSLFVVLHTLIDKVLALFEHAVDESREFSGHGRDGLRRSQPTAQPAILCAQIAVTFQ